MKLVNGTSIMRPATLMRGKFGLVALSSILVTVVLRTSDELASPGSLCPVSTIVSGFIWLTVIVGIAPMSIGTPIIGLPISAAAALASASAISSYRRASRRTKSCSKSNFKPVINDYSIF